MIRITQIKLPVGHDEQALQDKVLRLLNTEPSQVRDMEILRRAIDARKKPDLYFVYTVRVSVRGEEKLLRRTRRANISRDHTVPYRFPPAGTEPLRARPIIVGCGPAGLFCAYMLAQHGYRPVILERGDEAAVRKQKTESFRSGGPLDPDSNIQFGEGGAGTFSDGKLNTSVRDPEGRNHAVLSILHDCGAPGEILYDAKPHLGTDGLITVLANLRAKITERGGTFCFRETFRSFRQNGDGSLHIETSRGNRTTDVLVLAIGHSARDTYEMLWKRGVTMVPKPFAVGLRIAHPQEWINAAQYGTRDPGPVGAAPYRLAHTCRDGSSVYSFCMCPGGYIINASSETGALAVNGMSEHARDGAFANSAIVTPVTPEMFASCAARMPADPRSGAENADAYAPGGVLSGVAFQRTLEQNAFRAGGGAIPVQTLGDFRADRRGTADLSSGAVLGKASPANLRDVLPEHLCMRITEGIGAFGNRIRGFDDDSALLAGVESRTSSPVRIPRDQRYLSNIDGIYPCGEGAGYAGGITSAAIDGIRVAEAIASRFQTFS